MDDRSFDRSFALLALLVAIAAPLVLLALKYRQDQLLNKELEHIRTGPAKPDDAHEDLVSQAPPVKQQRKNLPPKAAVARRRVKGEPLPVIPTGSKCWYEPVKGLEMIEVKILKVHYDDTPPYYTIELPDGTEKQTLRGRIDSLEERAERFAQALLAEEIGRKGGGEDDDSKQGRRKKTSGHEKKSKQKKR